MKFLVSVLLLIAATLPAIAVERGTASQRAACTPDVFRLCASEIPDINAIVACLRREKAQLSNACRLVMIGDERQTATRSLAVGIEWCKFDGATEAVDEVWRAWCKGK